jgi:hypothetical protein
MEASIDRTSSSETGTEERSSDPALADIKEHWSWVRPALEEIIEDNLFMEVIPEDVYAACKAEDAHLWVTDDGFVVTTVSTDMFSGARSLFLWFAWAKKLGGSEAVSHTGFFEQVARDIKAAFLETRTAHQPVVEYLVGKAGWEVDFTALKKDVRDE